MTLISTNKCPFSYYIDKDLKHVSVKKDVPQCQENTQELILFLKETYKVIENGIIYKIQADTEVLQLLEKYLLNFSQLFDLNNEESIAVVTELYRSLRNCATNPQSQNFIVENTSILLTTKRYIEILNREHLCLKIILQFLNNLILSNTTATRKVHLEFTCLLTNLINNNLCQYECSALIYNISLAVPLDINLIELMLKLDECGSQNEFVLFFLEKCISSLDFWILYNMLIPKHKLIILDLIRSHQIQDKECNIHDTGLVTIIDCFLKSPDIFLKITSETTQEEVQEVSLLLEILSSISSKDEYIIKLQQNKNILVTASALLINFHRLGKNGDNLFTPVQKLAESHGNEVLNPIFGLKANLIQLVGNMCWKNNAMQNLVRQAEVIPVILDCCNIDANNPFIIQWCIFAIRNLCENNPENQKIIGGMQKKGAVPSSVLEEFGITLQGDGDSQLKIVPLNALENQ